MAVDIGRLQAAPATPDWHGLCLPPHRLRKERAECGCVVEARVCKGHQRRWHRRVATRSFVCVAACCLVGVRWSAHAAYGSTPPNCVCR
jgi:hypothetical protein